jgi:hypothetical protein
LLWQYLLIHGSLKPKNSPHSLSKNCYIFATLSCALSLEAAGSWWRRHGCQALTSQCSPTHARQHYCNTVYCNTVTQWLADCGSYIAWRRANVTGVFF